MAGSRTASRIQDGPRPGKVSPRRTAKPLSRKASRRNPGGSFGGVSGVGVDQHERGQRMAGDRQAELGQPVDQHRRGASGSSRWPPPPRRAPGPSCRPRWRPTPGWTPTTAAAARPGQPTRSAGAEQVTGSQSRDPPGLGQRTNDDESRDGRGGQGFRLAGNGVDEGLVDDDDPPWPGQAAEQGSRMQGPGRVRRIPDDDQIGAFPDQLRVQREPVGRVEQHPIDPVPGGQQRRLRFGELRVHHHRVPRPQRPGQQRERLRAAGGEQHLIDGPLVPPGHRRDRGGRPGIAAQGTGGRLDRLGQPGRRPGERTLTAKSIRWLSTSASPWWCRSMWLAARGVRLATVFRLWLRGLCSRSRRSLPPPRSPRPGAPRRRTGRRAAGARPSACAGRRRAGCARRGRPDRG